MKRYAENDLRDWFNSQNKKPLIIRGARQVGKSTLVKIFCENNNLELISVNLERDRLRSLEKDNFDISAVIDELQIISKKIIKQNSIIFFDEIQESPRLLKMLRYFYEERPELSIIAAGSLLEIALKDEKFSFPVGRVDFYHLGPMTFTEFLEATGNYLLVDKILNLDFSEHVDKILKEELLKYFYIGGMPAAVYSYVSSKSIVHVRAIQNQIIQTYLADFPKYNSRINTRRVERIFYSLANHLGKKVIFQKIDPDSQSREVKRILELLMDARVIWPCYHSNSNTVPLMGETDESIFKLYFLDIGILNAIQNLELDIIDDEFRNMFNTKGLLAEQFVAQHLIPIQDKNTKPTLNYWLKDKGINKAEIDFVISKSQKIVAIEVKSTATGHLKSLFHFVKEKRSLLGVKVSLEKFDTEKASQMINNHKVEFTLVKLPLYAIEKIYDVI